MISALPVKDHDGAFSVQCDLIEGSDAQGCMVVLQGTYNNVTVNVTRRHGIGNSVSATVNVAEPTPCYQEVYAFDIEYDGGVGTLAIPGQLSTVGESSMFPQCEQDSTSE